MTELKTLAGPEHSKVVGHKDHPQESGTCAFGDRVQIRGNSRQDENSKTRLDPNISQHHLPTSIVFPICIRPIETSD